MKIFKNIKISLLVLVVLFGVGYSTSVIKAQTVPNPTASELTATITSPTTNSTWASGSSQTINWRTTGLKDSVKGQIILTKPSTTSSPSSQQISQIPTTYYLVADNVPNTGSYLWNVGTAYILDPNRDQSFSSPCRIPSLDTGWNCYTKATTIPTGSYMINLYFHAIRSDLLPTVTGSYQPYWTGNIIDSSASGVLNTLGETVGETGSVVLNIGASGTVSTPPPTCTPPQVLINNVCTTPNQTQSQNPPPSPQGCSDGNLFNTQTGESCTKFPTPPALGCSGGNIYNTQTGQLCVNNSNQTPSQGSGALTYDFGTSTLKVGSKGDAVKELQRFLNDDLGLGLVLDGKLGPKTIAVIVKWQSDNGLTADGKVGPQTKIEMMKRIPKKAIE
ncbi:MAG: peptidoglycan-binding domain-containing protein [Candidatus Paceibacterota bacterium]|jgi:hypothetical protein